MAASTPFRRNGCSSRCQPTFNPAMGYQLDFGALSQYLGLFLEGTAVTLGLTLVASLLGISLGIGGAAASLSGKPWLKSLIGTYVELIRNTPFIVQMFFVFYGLPG